MFLIMSQIAEPNYDGLVDGTRGPVWATQRGWWLPEHFEFNGACLEGRPTDPRMRLWQHRAWGIDV